MAVQESSSMVTKGCEQYKMFRLMIDIDIVSVAVSMVVGGVELRI
jgi:hypothetical protein